MASQRDLIKADIDLVLDVLNPVILNDGPAPQPGAYLSVNQRLSGVEPGAFSVGESIEEAAIEDDVERLRRREEFNERRQDVINEAVRRVREAQREGTSLYLAGIDSADFTIVLEHAPEAVDGWLAGVDKLTESFINRLRRAEGFFVALCEQLLDRNPRRGVQLWRAIDTHALTRFIGKADIPHLYHLAFSAARSPETDTLCEELMSLYWCNNDDDVEIIAILIREGKRVTWARTVLNKEARDNIVWRRHRAARLSPLLSVPDLPCQEAWPAGPAPSTEDGARRMSYKMAHKEACARHWLRAYVQAVTLEDAHAAWCLFKASASRRVWLWLVKELDAGAPALRWRKKVYAQAEKQALEKAIKTSRNFLDSKLYGREIPEALSPWSS